MARKSLHEPPSGPTSAPGGKMNVHRAGPFPSSRPVSQNIGSERMRRLLLIVTCVPMMGLGPLFGQGITLAGTGYTDPSVIQVAPGQITTLFVTGLKTV